MDQYSLVLWLQGQREPQVPASPFESTLRRKKGRANPVRLPPLAPDHDHDEFTDSSDDEAPPSHKKGSSASAGSRWRRSSFSSSSSGSQAADEPAEPSPLSGLPAADEPGEVQDYGSLSDAIDALKEAERKRGWKYMRGESSKGKVKGRSVVVKHRLRCSSWGNSTAGRSRPGPQNKRDSHDAANRKRSRKRGPRCRARINLRLKKSTGRWEISSRKDDHDHDPPNADESRIQHPPTQQQREYIGVLATLPRMTRSLARALLLDKYPAPALTLRQVSNAMNAARMQSQEKDGGVDSDAASLVGLLTELKQADPGVFFTCAVDEETNEIRMLAAASSSMMDMLRQHGDVIIADASYARNRYFFPLTIYAAIDSTGTTRNVMYALHSKEDTEAHEWVLRQLSTQLPRPPEVVLSDHDLAFSAAMQRVFPSTSHLLCIHHIRTNLLKNLAIVLSRRWSAFQSEFWRVYRTTSPAAFEKEYQELVEKYPAARPYLDEYIYPFKKQWASAWTVAVFSAGARTTGRVESENGLTKVFATSKTTIKDLFRGLFKRAESQLHKSRSQPFVSLYVSNVFAISPQSHDS